MKKNFESLVHYILIVGSLVIYLVLSSGNAMATGAAQLKSIMIPVSVNAEGVILCKTKFQANRSGAHMLKPIDYGWAVICQNGTIIEYPDYHFDTHAYTDIDLQWKHYYFLEEKFNGKIDWDNPPLSLLSLIQRYGFNSNNAEIYSVDTVLNLHLFYEYFSIDPCSFRQTTLRKYSSTSDLYDQHILYRIDRIIFMRNYAGIRGTDTGSEFDTRFYVGPYFVNFDYYDITGSFVLPDD